MLRRLLVTIVSAMLVSSISFAEPVVVRVKLEPFPPLVNSDGSGLAPQLLKHLETLSELRFDIEVMSYSRAKFLLQNGEADLIGPVPVGMESKEFYFDAIELDWQVDTAADLYVMDRAMLDQKELHDFDIGTPLGNARFFAELTGVPARNFVETTLESLVQMLVTGRIDVLLFERASTLSMLRQMNIEEVFYQNMVTIPAGFAVRANEDGLRLKTLLDELLRDADISALLAEYELYMSMPAEGPVSLMP
ncbi:MAG: hypothetical protein CVV10_04420 [Gammaproteobacteria bacterium HGW-Gammaproteobacteria-14]|nr:MAG: hypothetical protein CVV10_04420 [Gammaproteobacteria bacterium HGW-Gammaproteobacteria-14]